MAADKDWYKTFFTGALVDFWLRIVPEEWTRQEVDFLAKVLCVPAGGKVLDVPCGGGRHALAMTARGYDVTAVDISPQFLTAARATANEQRQTVAWHERDMRDLPWPAAFDGAYCMGNSFGYLPDGSPDDENVAFLRAVAKALRPGARFVLDYPCVLEALLSVMVTRSWHEAVDGTLLLRDGRYDPPTGRMEVEYRALCDGRTDRSAMSQRAYTFRNVVEMLRGAGFADVQTYGSLEMEPFQYGSKRLLLVASR